MNDKINQIRFELRSLLSEEIQEQAIIAFEAMPGGEGDKAEWQSFIRITGFDASLSRGSTGYGGGVPTAGPSHGPDASLEKTEEDVGAWKVLGLPDRTATGMNAPSPWISFMDWMWDYLKSANLNPSPTAKGFGDVTKPYSQLTPAQKRQRKYGVPFKSIEDPEFANEPSLGDILKTRALSARARGIEKKKFGPKSLEDAPKAFRQTTPSAGKQTISHPEMKLWPAGFHIRREVTIVPSPLGEDQNIVAERFKEIISKAKPEPWFRIAWNHEWDVFLVYVNIDTEMPEGWRDRLAAMQIYHSKRKAEWEDLLRDFSQNRANVAQLRPILARYMVDKQKFEKPFRVEVLDDEQYNRAKQIVQQLKLEDLVEYARSIGIVPPVVGQIARSSTKKGLQFDKMWDNIIEKLAAQGAVDPLMTDVALSNWMSAHGFSDPFDFEMLPADKKLKALHMASKLSFADLSEMMESVKAQIKALLG